MVYSCHWRVTQSVTHNKNFNIMEIFLFIILIFVEKNNGI